MTRSTSAVFLLQSKCNFFRSHSGGIHASTSVPNSVFIMPQWYPSFFMDLRHGHLVIYSNKKLTNSTHRPCPQLSEWDEMRTYPVQKFAYAPGNCLHVALSPNAGYADLATCCAALQIIQPFLSITLTHPKLAGEDQEALPVHVGVMLSSLTLNSLDWNLMG